MKNNKIALTPEKMGEIRLPQDAFDVPKYGEIRVARIASKRDGSGEIIENTREKITLEVVDIELLNAIKAVGGNASNLSAITVDVIAEESILQSYKAEQLIGKTISLINAQVALKWVARGKSGGWNGFKVVVAKIELVTQSTPATAKAEGVQNVNK